MESSESTLLSKASIFPKRSLSSFNCFYKSVIVFLIELSAFSQSSTLFRRSWNSASVGAFLFLSANLFKSSTSFRINFISASSSRKSYSICLLPPPPIAFFSPCPAATCFYNSWIQTLTLMRNWTPPVWSNSFMKFLKSSSRSLAIDAPLFHSAMLAGSIFEGVEAGITTSFGPVSYFPTPPYLCSRTSKSSLFNFTSSSR